MALWAESAIGQGRYPFRKIETFPNLLTEKGELAPPLVFWINRDSFLAGGVLLFPEKEAEEDIERGGACARALGLGQFVTWAAREVVFWEERGESSRQLKALPLPSSSETSVDRFQDTLHQIMEELKIRSVTSGVPPHQLSPYCLANLCRTALMDVGPSLVEAQRRALVETSTRRSRGPEENLALGKGALTLARLLSALCFDLIPPTVQPEGLERAMGFATDRLPEELRRSLEAGPEELPLSAESAVRFHHLFRRLGQLRVGETPRAAAETIDILLRHEGPRLGACPAPGTEAPHSAPSLVVNSNRPRGDASARVEISPPPVLALSALWRALEGQAPAISQAAHPFELGPCKAPKSIRGCLASGEVPPSRQKQALKARLRNSWPTRRFALPAQAPLWAYEFIHLLGLADRRAEIELVTPGKWLGSELAVPLLALIKEQFTLRFLGPALQGGLELHLTKGAGPEAATAILGPDGPRQVSWGTLQSAHDSLLTLALTLPTPQWVMMEEGLLSLPTEADWPRQLERELFLFTRSTLGRTLWGQVDATGAMPSLASLQQAFLRHGCPLPPADVLHDLRLLDAGPDSPPPPQNVLDQELLRSLGPGAIPCAPQESTEEKPARHVSPPARPRRQTLERLISGTVFIDGIPRFPEHYLFHVPSSQLREYRVTGPLKARGEFFGQYVLEQADGTTLEVEGEETAKALILASLGDRLPLALPVERELTAEVLKKFLKDLRRLRQALLQECHLHLANPRSAKSLAAGIWRSHGLPPWEWLDDEKLLFIET
ncbi:hypothetical protein [uncultured Desulfuromonas sp.]|uniref:hypothetical protein n=1 Tax=uncultured Desulfuromonas sp. TaxID=181013 RepID=UPI002629706F|nr:hypothetical protein [uncultured Desulfuromonas sp.]